MHNFKNPTYLQVGNTKQKLAYKELMEIKLFDKLANYYPVLCGTIPIEIDTHESDLDIVCFCKNLDEFAREVELHFGSAKNFSLVKKLKRNKLAVIARFETTSFLVEIFGQNLPVEKQMAYMHMVVEAKILEEKDETFRKKIIELKKSGLKTEPAFAKLLNLPGDPYQALLIYKSSYNKL